MSFRHEVMPVLSKAGCNSGGCHGYSLGKNGFKLSLRGADPTPDYFFITKDSMSRRLNSDTAPWKPTTGLGTAGTSGATDPAGLEKPPPGIGPCFAMSVLTGNPATQRECQ